MSSWIIRVYPTSNGKCSHKRQRGDLVDTRAGVKVTMKAKVGGKESQPKECLEPLEVEEERDENSPRALKEICPCQHFNFVLLTSRTVCKKINFCYFNGNLLWKPQETNTDGILACP